MKPIKYILIILILIIPCISYSQESNSETMFGMELGWNAKVGGLGFFLDKAVSSNLSGYAGIGYGFWGFSGGIGGRYFFDSFYNGFYLGTGGCVFSGYTYDGVEISSIQKVDDAEVYKRYVTFCANILMGYSFILSDKDNLYFELGSSILLNNSYKAIDSDYDSSGNILSPGGLMFSIGYATKI